MTLSDISTYARELVNADTTSWTNASLLIHINTAYHKVVSMILESNDEADFDDLNATDYPILTTPMAAGQRDYQLPVSENVLKIKRVDISYDGTHYNLSTPIDDGETTSDMGANLTDTDQNFSTASPRHDVKYNSLWVYPAATAAQVALGAKIRIEWERQVTEFTLSDLTTGTLEPGFDRPFHPLVAYIAAYDFAAARQMPQLAQIQTEMTDWEVRLRQHYGRKILDRRFAMTPWYSDANFS